MPDANLQLWYCPLWVKTLYNSHDKPISDTKRSPVRHRRRQRTLPHQQRSVLRSRGSHGLGLLAANGLRGREPKREIGQP